MVKLVECPRDAMQGIKQFIDTEKKADYINLLLNVGFDTLDCGSFVSPKAIPQMADTALVLSKLKLADTSTKLSVIVANKRGAIDACFFDEVSILGYPFSISETFQQKNTNATIEASLKRVEAIVSLCSQYNKTLLIYLSMAFGNPYNDPWNADEVAKWIEKLSEMGIKYFALSDTVGVSNPENITQIFSTVIPQYEGLEIGAHFHTTPTTWLEKVEASYKAGCTKFDGAIKGYGGCPMAKDELTGNMPTEHLIKFFKEKELIPNIKINVFKNALAKSAEVFLD